MANLTAFAIQCQRVAWVSENGTTLLENAMVF
jgi:hypothetical protein